MKLLHLYHDFMNLYGEYGNMRVLEKHLRDQGMNVTVIHKTVTDTDLDFSDVDLIYIGCGTERSQKAALMHLMPYQEEIKDACRRGVAGLFTGNACDMLGTSITDGNGELHPALGLLPFTTNESADIRYTGDAVTTAEPFGKELVGFVNKCSQNTGIAAPLFTLKMGMGNQKGDPGEGCRVENFFGTHLIGPVLVKNPAMLHAVIRLLMKRENPDASYQAIAYPYEEKAYEVTHRALINRLEETGNRK